MRALVGIIIFTIIEVIALTGWLVILLPELLQASVERQVVAALFLFATILVEHIVAFNVGRGRPLFEIPRDS